MQSFRNSIRIVAPESRIITLLGILLQIVNEEEDHTFLSIISIDPISKGLQMDSKREFNGSMLF